MTVQTLFELEFSIQRKNELSKLQPGETRSTTTQQIEQKSLNLTRKLTTSQRPEEMNERIIENIHSRIKSMGPSHFLGIHHDVSFIGVAICEA